LREVARTGQHHGLDGGEQSTFGQRHDCHDGYVMHAKLTRDRVDQHSHHPGCRPQRVPSSGPRLEQHCALVVAGGDGRWQQLCWAWGARGAAALDSVGACARRGPWSSGPARRQAARRRPATCGGGPRQQPSAVPPQLQGAGQRPPALAGAWRRRRRPPPAIATRPSNFR
jgi:hypothetical protein